jgi:hypothetical protein
MNNPTRRWFRSGTLALALALALAQPVITTSPAHAAVDPIVTDGGRLKALRAVWDKYGPVIITLAWEVLTDWITPDPAPAPPPVESPPQDPEFQP